MEQIMKFLALVAIFAFSSCNQFDVALETTIHRDGTCSRQVIFAGDSAQLVAGCANCCLYNVIQSDAWSKSLSFEPDSSLGTWHLSFDTENSVEYLAKSPELSFAKSPRQHSAHLRAVRHFASVDEMAQASPLAVSGRQVKSKCLLEKKFRWFYTDYTFSETFESQASRFDVPITDFLSQDEVSYLLSGTPNIFEGQPGVFVADSLNTLVEMFVAYETAICLSTAQKFIEAHYSEIPNAPMTKEKFTQEASACIAPKRYHCLSKRVDNKIDILNEYVGSDVYATFLATQSEYKKIDSLLQKTIADIRAINADYVLSMPGDIISVNSHAKSRVVDDKLHFQFGGFNLLENDFTISATSRYINIWAFVFAIVIGLVAISLSIISICRK